MRMEYFVRPLKAFELCFMSTNPFVHSISIVYIDYKAMLYWKEILYLQQTDKCAPFRYSLLCS
jgi:hypothetical protein